jgi:hypothetical protein
MTLTVSCCLDDSAGSTYLHTVTDWNLIRLSVS